MQAIRFYPKVTIYLDAQNTIVHLADGHAVLKVTGVDVSAISQAQADQKVRDEYVAGHGGSAIIAERVRKAVTTNAKQKPLTLEQRIKALPPTALRAYFARIEHNATMAVVATVAENQQLFLESLNGIAQIIETLTKEFDVELQKRERTTKS